MIIIFLVFNTIMFLWTSLGILMFRNHLKKISRSIDIYLDPKAYKPESEVRFISVLLGKYRQYENRELLDQDSLIKDHFYASKIGKFKVSAIETLTNKGTKLLWLSIIIMAIFEAVTVGLGQSNLHSIAIIISASLGIILAFFELYADLEMGKKQLFLKIKNHLNNEYPQFKINQKEKEQVSFLLKKIDQLENKISQHETTQFQLEQEEKINQENLVEELQEEDIVQILKCFDIFT